MNFVDWEITFNNTHFVSFFARQKRIILKYKLEIKLLRHIRELHIIQHGAYTAMLL